MKDNTPVYIYPAEYARENNELEQYRASYKANVTCKEAIEKTITEHYSDNRLGIGAVRQVVEQFGFDRTFYVLANTVREKDWDGRISRENKEWAKTIPVFEDKDSYGTKRNCYYVVDAINPGLTDIFINQARREYLLTQPLTKEDIKKEALRLLGRMQSEREPNSPGGTHYMAEISPDFMIRAKSKDTGRLAALLPFQSLVLSTVDNRKGVFTLIAKDENRNQPLRQRKPSVRDKLQMSDSEPKLPIPGKAKERER